MINNKKSTLKDSFETQLDQYDLLSGEQQVALPETDLTGTVGAFNLRIQRKKKEQELAGSAEEKSARIRHALMLEAMTNIRRALKDVARINLGDRFKLELILDDWHGWPRLTVKLFDLKIPDGDYPFLQVITHDRQSRGTIEVIYHPSQAPDRISLTDQSDLKRLPVLLKKCVRAFLDYVGDVVLEAERKLHTDEIEHALSTKKLEDFESKQHQTSTTDITSDLFSDEIYSPDLLERLPNVGEIKELPDILSSK